MLGGFSDDGDTPSLPQLSAKKCILTSQDLFISKLILAPLLLPLFQAIDVEWIGTKVLWPNLYLFIDCFYRQKGEILSQEGWWCSQPGP